MNKDELITEKSPCIKSVEESFNTDITQVELTDYMLIGATYK